MNATPNVRVRLLARRAAPATSDFHQFVTADMHFHQTIAGAAGNALLEELLHSVHSLIRVWVERALDDSEHARLACSEHRAILDALGIMTPPQRHLP